MALTQVKTTGLADDAVTGAKIADDTVAEANMANDAISLTELKAGTDGQIISWDASGNPVAIGPGTDGQVLTSTGAGSPPAFEAVPAGGATINNATENEIVTVASNTAQLDAESTLTYDGQTLAFNSTTPAIRFEDSDSSGTPITDIDGGGGDLDIKIDTGDEKSGNKLRVYTNGTEIVRVSDDGHVKIQDGNLIIGTAGHGIDFSATSDGSGTDTSELLDDYEEGEWTPVYNTGAGQISNHAYQNGRYLRVGHLCYVSMWMRGASNSGLENGSGDLWITGLPYAPASFPSATINDYTYLSTANDGNYHHWYITAEYYNDRFYVYGKTSSSNQAAMGGDLIAATDINYRGCFRLA